MYKLVVYAPAICSYCNTRMAVKEDDSTEGRHVNNLLHGDPVNIIHKVALWLFGPHNNVWINVLMYTYIQLSTTKAGMQWNYTHYVHYMTSDMCTAPVHHAWTKQWTNSSHSHMVVTAQCHWTCMYIMNISESSLYICTDTYCSAPHYTAPHTLYMCEVQYNYRKCKPSDTEL